jgi:hypothetical protein
MFPDLDRPKKEEAEEVEILYIELWDTLKPLYDMYSILKDYFLADYLIDSALMLALINDSEELTITKTLSLVRYLHYSYIKIIQPQATTNDG